jgi:hypothetical protein
MTGALPRSSCCGLRLGVKIDVSQVSSRSFDNVRQIDAAQLVELIDQPACSKHHAFGYAGTARADIVLWYNLLIGMLPFSGPGEDEVG